MKRLVLPALLLAGALSGCGGDNGSDTVGQASPTPTPTPTPTVTVSGCPSTPATKDLKTKPVPTLPAGSTPPATTTSTDVVVGKGATAKDGSQVKVKYVGVLFSDCKEFDSSWSRGATETLPFTIGSGVIPGFSKGTAGMKVGGRRQIVIPPSEGYGDQDNGPIPGGSTLIFVIDLVSVS
jgi:FKBP-type peptidyl-prolyl cis-trans isomerase